MSSGPPVDLAQFASVFLVKPSSLGDIVHALPAARALKRAFPHLHLRWLCNTEWMPLLEGNPDVTEVLPFPRSEFRSLASMPRFLLWAAKLNKSPRELPELTLDLQGLFRSAFISLARGNDPVIGMSDAREFATSFYRCTVGVDAAAHAVDRSLAFVRGLGADVDSQPVEFPLPAGTRPAEIELPRDYLVLHPYSRGKGKSLPPAVIQSLCDCLAPRPVLIVGRSAAPVRISGHHVTDLVNRTSLPELLWLLRHAHGCVSVDSGPMHVAAALLERTLGLHTWSDPRKVGPYPATARVWKAGRIAARSDFSDSEARDVRGVEVSDARRIADHLLHQWYRP